MVVILSENSLKLLHDIVMENDPRAVRGYSYKSMIKGSMDRALTQIYGCEPFVDIIAKAAALMHSIIFFHPFNDGNKRTALLTTYFFLMFNGYAFNITPDAVSFALKISRERISDVKVVEGWLRKNIRQPFLLRLVARIFYSRRREIDFGSTRSAITALSLPILEFTKDLFPKK